MFGFGKNKERDVRLTEQQIRELTKNMSRSELREFERRQKEAEEDKEWDAMMFLTLFDDDD